VTLAAVSLLGCAHQHVDPTITHPELAVLRVNGPEAGLGGYGFLISANGMIVTTSRLISDGSKVVVTLPDGTTFPATFVEEDREAGVAIIKIAGEGYPFLHLRGDDIEPPMHIRVGGGSGVSQGVFDHWESAGQAMALTARITAYDAGAPVLADDGTVIGVVREPSAAADSPPLATPIWHVTRMLPAQVK
jgi:S1-C subfamily serine protease